MPTEYYPAKNYESAKTYLDNARETTSPNKIREHLIEALDFADASARGHFRDTDDLAPKALMSEIYLEMSKNTANAAEIDNLKESAKDTAIQSLSEFPDNPLAKKILQEVAPDGKYTIPVYKKTEDFVAAKWCVQGFGGPLVEADEPTVEACAEKHLNLNEEEMQKLKECAYGEEAASLAKHKIAYVAKNGELAGLDLGEIASNLTKVDCTDEVQKSHSR